jgi:hypothetical protein
MVPEIEVADLIDHHQHVLIGGDGPGETSGMIRAKATPLKM